MADAIQELTDTLAERARLTAQDEREVAWRVVGGLQHTLDRRAGTDAVLDELELQQRWLDEDKKTPRR